MHACVFYGNLSALVNGCTTKEICIKRWLNKGDPLSHFVSLLVVERFSGMFSGVIEFELFLGFRVRAFNLVVSHHQYVDDTFILGEASIENICLIEAIIRAI